MAEQATGYVMGHTDRERRRLSLQASVLNPLTEEFLRRAGISAGITYWNWIAAWKKCR